MIEVLKQALEALKSCSGVPHWPALQPAITSLRQAIAELESQTPVTRYCCHSCFKTSGGVMLDRMIVCPTCGNKRCPKASDHTLQCTNSNDLNQVGSIYTYPPQRTWVGLTDEDIKTICSENGWDSSWQSLRFAQAIEAKLKQKNGYVAQETNS